MPLLAKRTVADNPDRIRGIVRPLIRLQARSIVRDAVAAAIAEHFDDDDGGIALIRIASLRSFLLRVTHKEPNPARRPTLGVF